MAASKGMVPSSLVSLSFQDYGISVCGLDCMLFGIVTRQLGFKQNFASPFSFVNFKASLAVSSRPLNVLAGPKHA